MPILKKCCCCCELSTGAIILGWVTLIARVLILITVICLLSVGQKLAAKIKLNIHEVAEEKRLLDICEANKLDSYAISFEKWYPVMFGLVFLIIALMTIASIYLIIGATQRRRMMFVPYLVCDTINVILCTMIWIVSVASLRDNISSFIATTIVTGLSWYWYLSVISFFQQIKDDKSNRIAQSAQLKRQNPELAHPY